MVWVMIYSTLIGIAPIHLLVSQWSDIFAWSITILSIIFISFLMYDYVKIRSKPILLNSKILRVNRGIIRHVDIPLENIDAMYTNMMKEEDKNYMDLALLNEKNIYLDLIKPVVIKSIFKNTQGDKIAFYVDKQDAFIKQLKEYACGL
jgi:hypothetical protein